LQLSTLTKYGVGKFCISSYHFVPGLKVALTIALDG